MHQALTGCSVSSGNGILQKAGIHQCLVLEVALLLEPGDFQIVPFGTELAEGGVGKPVHGRRIQHSRVEVPALVVAVGHHLGHGHQIGIENLGADDHKNRLPRSLPQHITCSHPGPIPNSPPDFA